MVFIGARVMNESIIEAQVEQISPLTDSIIQLFLTPEVYQDYQPGQYLHVLMGEETLSYSIANAPLGSHQYELHIRHTRDNSSNQRLFAHIKKLGTLSLKLPFGDCHLDRLDSNRPIIFVAQGTGFAPVKAMIEQLLASDDPRPFELFWGGRSQSDLYLDEKVKNWQKHVARFNYQSFISEEGKETLTPAILAQPLERLQESQIVISGPFDRVYSIRDGLVERGVAANQLYSDAFSFEQKE